MLDDDDDAATANADLDPSYGEDLITQAYSSLLSPFSSKTTAKRCDEPLTKRYREEEEGKIPTAKLSAPQKNGVQAMVDTLEQFHAFHDTLDAMVAVAPKA